MTVPSVVRLLPAGSPVGTAAEGPTAGRHLVEVYGDGFRLPSTTPVPGPSGPIVAGLVQAPSPQTVSVTFGGVEAESVEVVRSNLLRVLTPISPIAATKAAGHGAGAVDVVIQNLDDNGDPIAGESVTVVDGYTYRHVKLDAATESDFLRLVQRVIEEWKRQVLPNVVLTEHVDYDADTATPYTEIAELPAVILQGPDLPENRFYSLNEPPEEADGTVVEIRRKPRTVDLLFQVIGISENTMELLNLVAAASAFMERNPYLYMARDPDDAAAGEVRYEFDYQAGGDFRVASRPSSSNIRSFTGAIVVRGFDFEGFAGVPGDALRGLAATLQEDVALDAESV